MRQHEGGEPDFTVVYPTGPYDWAKDENLPPILVNPEEGSDLAGAVESNIYQTSWAFSTYVAKIAVAAACVVAAVPQVKEAIELRQPMVCGKQTDLAWDTVFAEKRGHSNNNEGWRAISERQADAYLNRLDMSQSSSETEGLMQTIFDQWSVDFKVEETDNSKATSTTQELLGDLIILPTSIMEQFEGGTIVLKDSHDEQYAGLYESESSSILIATQYNGDAGVFAHEAMHMAEDAACKNFYGEDKEFREANGNFEYGSTSKSIKKAFENRTLATPYAGTNEREDFADTALELLFATPYSDPLDIYRDCRTVKEQKDGMCKKALITIARLEKIEPNIIEAIADVHTK